MSLIKVFLKIKKFEKLNGGCFERRREVKKISYREATIVDQINSMRVLSACQGHSNRKVKQSISQTL